MQVATALATRQSIRAFLDKPVSHELVTTILEHARYAPSGTNTQPWQVAVVSGATKQALDHKLLTAFRNNEPKNLDYNYYPTQMPPEMKQRRLACGLQMYSVLGIGREDKEKRLEQWEKNYTAFGAPTALYFFTNNLVEKGSYLDCGMFIQSVMLMAVELGLATCAQAALAEYPAIVKQHLGYPDDSILLCGMALGYPDRTATINSYKTPREEVGQFTRFFD